MNIDKNDMSYAYANRHIKTHYEQLIRYFEEMSNYFSRKFGIRYPDSEEIKQEAMIVAVNAIDKYDITKKSTPFSYFYKVINVAFMYHLRKQKMKADRRPKTCNIDAFSDIGTDFEEFENDNEIISVNGRNFEKSDLISKTKTAVVFAQKAIKIRDLNERDNFINSEADEFIKKIVKGYIHKKEKR